jgi:hypothetical protein
MGKGMFKWVDITKLEIGLSLVIRPLSLVMSGMGMGAGLTGGLSAPALSRWNLPLHRFSSDQN